MRHKGRKKIKEKCDYCKNIEKSTPASPRRKYKYCPMCGRTRGTVEFDFEEDRLFYERINKVINREV